MGVGRGEDRLPAQLADARLVQGALGALGLGGLALALGGLDQLPPGTGIGPGNLPGSPEQAGTIRLGHPGQQLALGGDGFQQLSGGLQPLGERKGI